MTTRETKIELVGEKDLTDGLDDAIGAGYNVTGARISRTLHNKLAHVRFRAEVEASPALREFRNFYDFRPEVIPEGGHSGWFFGRDVIIDETLTGLTLVIQSGIARST